MPQILWKLPERWRAPGLAERAALYPALYLRGLGFKTALRRNLSRRDLTEADAFVLVCEDDLAPGDHDVLRRARERDAPVLLIPLGGISQTTLEALTGVRCAVAAAYDDGPLSSSFPEPAGLRALPVPGCAARAAEDALLSFEPTSPPDDPEPAPGRPHMVLAVEDGAALAACAPAVRKFVERSELRLVIATDRPDRLVLDSLDLPDPVLVSSRSPGLLTLMEQAQIFLCAYPTACPMSQIPGNWVRTALFHGAPVVAASHASIDGLAHLCVLDDWDRGLALYAGDPVERKAAAVRAQTFLALEQRPSRIAEQWRAALASLPALAPISRGAGRRVVLVLIDLSQDIELLLPILLALRERGVLRLRIVVTDWLRTELPRTLRDLTANGLDFEVVDRRASRQGELPDLTGVDGVLTASETTAGPHRAAHRLAKRAAARGLATFTLQHGFENIGLTYRDAAYGPEVAFASDTIFTWGPTESLPDWLSADTRRRLFPVGSPKSTPPPARRLRLSDREWRRTVGVFENLHWDRFDDDFRRHFLGDLKTVAGEAPDVLFLVKPHHAGRWLSKNPDALAQTVNLKILHPSDPAWQPYTAPALIASMDALVTTPSTVAMDAARAGRPIAVAGYQLDLSLYAPLPILKSAEDWREFLAEDADGFVRGNETFLQRVLLPGRGDHRIAGLIEQAMSHPRTDPGPAASAAT